MFKHGFPPEWSTFKKLIWLVGSGIAGAASGIWKTVTGTLIHITDALASPVKELSVAIEPQQSGTGDPSPDNVRPITGWTGLNLSKAGSNLMSSKTIVGDNYNKNAGNTLSSSSGASASGTNPITVVNTTNWRGVGFFSMPLKKGETYYFRVKTNASSTSNGKETYYLVNSSNKILKKITYASLLSNTTHYLAIQNVEYDNCFFVYFVESSSTQTITLEDMRLVLASNQSYEDRQGETIPILWETEAGTVYGGTLDVVNGTLTVTKATKTFDENDAWDITGSVFFVNRSLTDFLVGDTYHLPYFICNKYEFQKYVSVSSNAKVDGVYTNAHNTFGKRIFVKDSNYSTVDAFKASLVGSPITVCGELVEPITYTLTPQQISTLAGENNIWADCGDTTLIYQAVPETAFSDEADTGMADYMTLTE